MSKVKNKLMRIALLGIICIFALMLTSCSTKPEKGYVTAEYIKENVIDEIDSSVTYSSFNCTYLLNYFATESEYLPPRGENQKTNYAFTDSPNQYSSSCASLFLDLPLHITPTNWVIYKDDNKIDTLNSTKNRLESKIYQPGSEYDYRIYYYEREDGGFYLKTFGTNKSLKINQLFEDFQINCSGKWNITCEYDKDGFLVSERFETINAHREDDTKSVYGYAIYTYNK